jgi:hypothetical protein
MSSTLDRKIQKVTVPTIALDEMSMTDTDDKNNPMQSSDRKTTQSGSLYPLIQINQYKFTENELVAFNLDLTGFVPTVKVTVASSDGVFLSKSYPKDGDPLSVFVRSRIDEFSPIRCDFEIESISSHPSTDSSGDVVSYTIEGSLRIPRLYAEFCKAFRNMSSYDALLQIATDMKLGFASNDTITNDKQTWLCPFDPYSKFVNDVTKASYKDDDSFFNSWIDHYYILNFVNVNTQFGEEFDLEAAMDVLAGQKDHNAGQELNKFDTKIMLSNHRNLRGQANWISGYTLLNNCGNVVQANGYRRYIQFYDSNAKGEPKDKYKSYFIEPLSTKGVDDKILLRGRTKEPEIFQEQNKNKFMGIQISAPIGAVHENYLHAKVNNWQNQQEISKMILHVSLAKCNFNLYRGQRVPVLILNQGGNMRQKLTQDPEIDNATPISVDKFLSGYYYIIGMNISWDNSDANFFQDVYLARREWPIPHQTEDNIAQG